MQHYSYNSDAAVLQQCTTTKIAFLQIGEVHQAGAVQTEPAGECRNTQQTNKEQESSAISIKFQQILKKKYIHIEEQM